MSNAIAPKSDETILDRLKSRKFWITMIGTILPIVTASTSDQVSMKTGLTTAACVLVAGIAGISLEDFAKHLRDGKIAQAERRE